jgi:hypothetical protein
MLASCHPRADSAGSGPLVAPGRSPRPRRRPGPALLSGALGTVGCPDVCNASRSRMAGGPRSRKRAANLPSCASSSGAPVRSHSPRALYTHPPEHGPRHRAQRLRKGPLFQSHPSLRTAAWPSWWSSGAARAHAVVVSVLTSVEILIAARRLAEARPHLAAVAGIVHHEDQWQLCRDELTGVDVRTGGWDIPRPLVRRGRPGHVMDGGAAPRRDDPMARDRRPDRTARTPRLALTRWSPP